MALIYDLYVSRGYLDEDDAHSFPSSSTKSLVYR